MQRFSHQKAIMTGRCLAEVEWATTPRRKRPRAWSGLPGRPDEIRRVPRAFAAWAWHGAEQRWRELVDAEETIRTRESG
jgi:hypothetical protein